MIQGKCHRGKRGHLKKDCRADLPDVSDSAAEDQKKCVSFMASRDKRTAKLVFKLVGSEVRATDGPDYK